MSRLRRRALAADDGAEPDAAQGEGDQRDDDERVEDDGAQDRRLRRRQPHDVERAEDGERAGEHGRDDGEVLGDVVGDRERRQRAARDEQLLADLHDLDELGGVGVEIDHVAGLARGLRAAVHRHADVGLGEGRRVVGAVAGHGDERAAGLLAADERHLVLGRRLREEVVDARLLGDRLRRARVVAGDHDRADAHAPQLVEALAHAVLDDVLEADDAERDAVLGDDQRRAAGGGDAVDELVELDRRLAGRPRRGAAGRPRPRPCGSSGRRCRRR